MRRFRLLVILSLASLVPMAVVSNAQEPANSAKTIEITPAKPDVSVGQKMKFTVVSKDAASDLSWSVRIQKRW